MTKNNTIRTGGVYTFSRTIQNGSLVVESIINNRIKATFFNMYDQDVNTTDTMITRYIDKSWFENNLPSYVCQISDLWGRSDTSRIKALLFKNAYQLDTGKHYSDACEFCGVTNKSIIRVKFKDHIICAECFNKYTSFCKRCGCRIFNSLTKFSNSSEFCDNCLDLMKKETLQESGNYGVEDPTVIIPPKKIEDFLSKDKKSKDMYDKVYYTHAGIPYIIDEKTGKRYFYLTVSHSKSIESDKPDKIRKSDIIPNNKYAPVKYRLVNDVFNDKNPSITFSRSWWSEDLIAIFATISVKAIATKYDITSSEASIIKRNALMLINNKEIKPANGTSFATLFNQGFTLDEVINMHKEDTKAVITSYKTWLINSNSTPDSNAKARIKWETPITFMPTYDLATKFIDGNRVQFSNEEKCSYSIACDIFDDVLTNQLYYEPLAIAFGPMAFKLGEIEPYIGSLRLKEKPTLKDKCDLIVYDKIMKIRAAYINSFNDHSDYIFKSIDIESDLIPEELYPDLLMLVRNRFGILTNNLTESEKYYISTHSIEEVASKFIWRYNKVYSMKQSIAKERNKSKEINCVFDCYNAESMHEVIQMIGVDGIFTIRSALARIKVNSKKIAWCYEHILAPKDIIDKFYSYLDCFKRIPKDILKVFYSWDEDSIYDCIADRSNIEFSLNVIKGDNLNLSYDLYNKYMCQLAPIYGLQ